MEEKETSPNRKVIEKSQTEQLRKLSEQYDGLKQKFDRIAPGNKSAYAEQVAQLGEKKAVAEANLVKMQNEDTEGFYELSLSAQITLDEFKEALCLLNETFCDPEEQVKEEPSGQPAPAGREA